MKKYMKRNGEETLGVYVLDISKISSKTFQNKEIGTHTGYDNALLKTVFVLLLKQWFWKLTYTVDIGKAGKRGKQNAAQERIRVYKQICRGQGNMEERIEIYCRVFGEAREKKF